ncbi:hypothetical protein [Brucella tritici]
MSSVPTLWQAIVSALKRTGLGQCRRDSREMVNGIAGTCMSQTNSTFA